MRQEHDRSGKRWTSVQSLKFNIQVEMLPESGWETIAAHELSRLKLELQGYLNQLEGKPGCGKLQTAIESVTAARQEILDSDSGESDSIFNRHSPH